MNKQTHTDDTEEILFYVFYVLFPLFIYILITPMPGGWSSMSLSLESIFTNLNTYLFITFTAIYISFIVHSVKKYRECFGNAVELKPAQIQHKEKISNARIVRKNNSITVYDEKNKVIYKKL